MKRIRALGLFTLTLCLMLLLAATTSAQSDVSNFPLQVTDLNGDGLVDCAGACDGDIYTIVDFNDALALLYGGLHHNGVKNCDTDARRALVAQWGTLFFCRDSCPNGLRHAWRNADLSRDTLNFLSMVGLSRMAPPHRTGSRPAVIDFCNAYSVPPTPRYGGDSDSLDNDPIRIPCDPHEDVCRADGTLGVVLPIVPPTNLSTEDNYPSAQCTEGVFEKAHEKSGFCPDGTPPTFGLCSLPVMQDDSGSTDFRCTNASNNCPIEAPLNADCRAYNLVGRTQDGAVQKDPARRDVRSAFFRIHASNSTTGQTCNTANAKDQISCLASAVPDSVGLAYGGSTPPPRILFSDDFLMGQFANTLGFISNAYGTFQAAIAIKDFLLGSESDIEKAKDEILTEIKKQQSERISGSVFAVVKSFNDVRSVAQNPNPNDVEFIKTEGEKVMGEIQAVVDNGDVGQAYHFAPAYNTISVMVTIAKMLQGLPQTQADDIIQTTLEYNYKMVGADLIDVSECACTGLCQRLRTDASLDKLLWRKFRFPTLSCGNPDPIPPPASGPSSLFEGEVCDLNAPAECWYAACRDGSHPMPGLGGVVCPGNLQFFPLCRPEFACALPPGSSGFLVSMADVPKCYDQAVSLAVAKFNKDDVVDVIKRAISSANADGFRTVPVSQLISLPFFHLSFSTTATILDASFRQQPPGNRRLPNPACPMQ